jgi:hypothetical protein
MQGSFHTANDLFSLVYVANANKSVAGMDKTFTFPERYGRTQVGACGRPLANPGSGGKNDEVATLCGTRGWVTWVEGRTAGYRIFLRAPRGARTSMACMVTWTALAELC